MKILIFVITLALPLFMFFLTKKKAVFSLIFIILAYISGVVSGSIAASAVYENIEKDTVFMTVIHGLLLHPLFLLSAAYLGLYFLYHCLQQLSNARKYS